ncbi:TraX family protein [Paenibacillus sp. FSL H7-0442]|uniref:TraX family protein n=1 Tax=Paenibacillus sp. FSL H7-0442 TaxID=2921435 RepID=UPI003158067E
MEQRLSVQAEVKGIDATSLKLIAVLAMLIDHIGGLFFADFLGFQVVGRITLPIMAFFVAEGYIHTRSFKKYTIRLALTGLASVVPYGLVFKDWYTSGNIMLTLLMGLLAIWFYDNTTNPVLKYLAISALCVVSFLGDWSVIGVLLVLAFYVARKQQKIYNGWIIAIIALMFIFGVIIIWAVPDSLSIMGISASTMNEYLYPFAIGGACIFALPLLSRYNGERGKGSRTFFYLFYPLHLLALYLLKLAIDYYI